MTSNAKKINIVEIVAATLSAVSTAIAASFLGVTGTIAGAAVGSVLGTIATAFYANSLHHGTERLKKARRIKPTTPTTGTVYGRRKRPRWPLAVATTAAAFALAIGAITIAELAVGSPVANLYGGHATGTTTITTVSHTGPTETAPAPTTSATTGTSASPSATEPTDATPAPEPSATADIAPTATTAPQPTPSR
jgi:hypothetical protein